MFPELGRLRERVVIVRGLSIKHEPNVAELKRQVDLSPKSCGGEAAKAVEEIFTANGVVRPRIEIAPKERQFWRIVNASADRYLDLQLDERSFEIVALDGMPLAYHEPEAPTRSANHLLLAPAGRLEAIVTGSTGLERVPLCASFAWMPALPGIRIRRWCWPRSGRTQFRSGQFRSGYGMRIPAWLDTVNVPSRGDVILDFPDPIIKGVSVFHCHLRNHEDKGMVAKILFK